jgi:cold shock protein
MEGTIKKLITDKGFGFITVDGEEKDLFFHGKELKGVTFEELKEGDRVSFDKGDSPKGPNATNVTKI